MMGNGHFLMHRHWSHLPSHTNGISWSQKGRGLYRACKPSFSPFPHSPTHMLRAHANVQGHAPLIQVALSSAYIWTRCIAVTQDLLSGVQELQGLVPVQLLEVLQLS